MGDFRRRRRWAIRAIVQWHLIQIQSHYSTELHSYSTLHNIHQSKSHITVNCVWLGLWRGNWSKQKYGVIFLTRDLFRHFVRPCCPNTVASYWSTVALLDSGWSFVLATIRPANCFRQCCGQHPGLKLWSSPTFRPNCSTSWHWAGCDPCRI